MDATRIRKMLKNINADFAGMGRPETDVDKAIVECLLRFYDTKPEIEWQEIRWLYVNYMQNDVLDFPEAKRRARLRRHMIVTALKAGVVIVDI